MTGAEAAEPLAAELAASRTRRAFGSAGPAGRRCKLPSPELEERKVVITLFADLEASTELAARLDPEDLRGSRLRPYSKGCCREVM